MLLTSTGTGLDIFLLVWVVVIIATVIGELLTADLSCIWYKAINPNARPIHIISLLTMTAVIQSPISMAAKITLIT